MAGNGKQKRMTAARKERQAAGYARERLIAAAMNRESGPRTRQAAEMWSDARLRQIVANGKLRPRLMTPVAGLTMVAVLAASK